jgi:hypothetical protein
MQQAFDESSCSSQPNPPVMNPLATIEKLTSALEVPAGELLKSIRVIFIRLTHLINRGNIKV